MRAHHGSLARLVAALACLGSLLGGCTSKIDEVQVRTVLEAVDKAANEKNAAGIVAHMADDVVVKVSIPDGRTSKTLSLDRDQYRKLLQDEYGAVQAYEFDRKSTRIKIARDGKSAKVKSRISEIIKNQQGSRRVYSLQTATFEVRNGEVVMTKVESIQRT